MGQPGARADRKGRVAISDTGYRKGFAGALPGAFRNPVTAIRDMSYPPNLAGIVDLFDALSDEEKRENLIAYADGAPRCAPRPGETYAL